MSHPTNFYKTAAITKYMLVDKEAPEAEIGTDTPARIIETITAHQLSPEDKAKTNAIKKYQLKNMRLPRGMHDFDFKKKMTSIPYTTAAVQTGHSTERPVTKLQPD